MRCTCPNCGTVFEAMSYGGKNTAIRLARRDKALTVAEAAKKLGISTYTLEKLERGQMDPRLSVIQKACDLYGKTAEQLFPASERSDTPSEEEVEQAEFEAAADEAVLSPDEGE